MDRDRVVELLRVAAGDGRLTPDELDERLEAALTARTYSELAVLTTDLPAITGHQASVAVPEVKELVRIDCGAGTANRDGQWVVPQRMEVRVTAGSVRLDLTKAIITGPVLRLDADVRSGSLTVVTRPGIEVDTDDVAVRSGTVRVRHTSRSRCASDPAGPGDRQGRERQPRGAATPADLPAVAAAAPAQLRLGQPGDWASPVTRRSRGRSAPARLAIR